MGDFHSEGKKTILCLNFMLKLILSGLDLAGLDALGDDLEEIEEDFDHEIEVDEFVQIELMLWSNFNWDLIFEI